MRRHGQSVCAAATRTKSPSPTVTAARNVPLSTKYFPPTAAWNGSVSPSSSNPSAQSTLFACSTVCHGDFPPSSHAVISAVYS